MVSDISHHLSGYYCDFQTMVVPVVAVLTKYEALVDRLQDASGGNPVTKKDIVSGQERSRPHQEYSTSPCSLCANTS